MSDSFYDGLAICQFKGKIFYLLFNISSAKNKIGVVDVPSKSLMNIQIMNQISLILNIVHDVGSRIIFCRIKFVKQVKEIYVNQI